MKVCFQRTRTFTGTPSFLPGSYFHRLISGSRTSSPGGIGRPGVSVSNTVIVLVSLGVSPWAAVGSLAFLVLVHKLEYLLNAKIVGGRIGASAWETLLAILVFEAAFGIPGVILAPVVYAWAKAELVDRGLV